MYYLGVDPGKTGAWAMLEADGTLIQVHLFESFKQFHDNFSALFCFALLEQASARPGQGVCSMFTFGQNYGGWMTTFELMSVQYQLITPQKWQKAVLGSFPKGESKTRALAFAQRKWPTLNLKKKDSGKVDALCIAYYARQLHLSHQGEEHPLTHLKELSGA